MNSRIELMWWIVVMVVSVRKSLWKSLWKFVGLISYLYKVTIIQVILVLIITSIVFIYWVSLVSCIRLVVCSSWSWTRINLSFIHRSDTLHVFLLFYKSCLLFSTLHSHHFLNSVTPNIKVWSVSTFLAVDDIDWPLPSIEIINICLSKLYSPHVVNFLLSKNPLPPFVKEPLFFCNRVRVIQILMIVVEVVFPRGSIVPRYCLFQSKFFLKLICLVS